MNMPIIVHEHKVTTEHNDVMDVGVIRVNEGETAVAYAALGKTTVCLSRGADGKVHIEIDDIAEEDVHISVNTFTLTASQDDTRSRPWHEHE